MFHVLPLNLWYKFEMELPTTAFVMLCVYTLINHILHPPFIAYPIRVPMLPRSLHFILHGLEKAWNMFRSMKNLES